VEVTVTSPKHTIELLAPTDSHSREDFAIDRLAEIVLQRIAAKEAASERPETDEELSESILMQPWCLPAEVARTIRRIVPVWHWHKHSWVYDDNGCFKCERKDVPHQSLGMCQSCHAKYLNRVKAAIVKRRVRAEPNIRDMKAALTLKADSAKKILAELGVVSTGSASQPSTPLALPASATSSRLRKRSQARIASDATDSRRPAR
jgi:hypothetical protein